MALILRQTKGAPLTYGELDGNFTFISNSFAGLSGSNTFNGNQTIVGNLNVFGSASFTYVTSSISEISSSIFGITISTPSIRYGLYNVYDVGSTKTTASFAWDSTNSYWLYQKVTGSVTSSAIFLTGPKGTGGLGTEAIIPQYRVPMSNGDQSLVNSNIFTSGSFNTITGSTFIYSFASYSTPTLGTGSGGFFLGGDSGFYGLYMGVSSSGTTWIQSNRNDGLGLAYNIALQPVGGNVNIGKFNPATTGPKLDISGSTLLTGSLGILGNVVITGSLIVTGGVTATASYAQTLDGLDSSQFVQTTTNQTIFNTKTFDSPVVLGVDDSFTGNGKLTFNTIDSFNIGNIKISLEGGQVPTGGINTEYGDLLFTDNNNNVLAGLYQDGTGFKIITGSFIGNLIGTASFATTSSRALSSSFATTSSFSLQTISASFATTASYILNAVSSSFASTASFLRPLSQSVNITGSVSLTGSLGTRNTATTTTFFTVGRSGSLYIDLNGVGNNYIDGNALFIRNSAGTTNLVTISGSTTTINTTTTISGSLNVNSFITAGSSLTATGSLGINKINGDLLLLATSSITSSISSSNNSTNVSFDGTIFLNNNPGGNPWNSNFEIYYSGVSGSGETAISPVYTASSDSNPYQDFTFGSTPRPQITLSPSGSIQSYKIYIYDSGSSNSGPRWYVKSAINETDLNSGITVTLSGPTDNNFGTDLVNTAGFSTTSSPTSNVNTITYVSQSLLVFLSSSVNINASTTITGSLSVSGSTVKIGNNTLTGTNTISGSNIISGSNTIIGNTVISGSQIMSGSNTIIGNTIISGSITISGSATNNIIGTTTITGSLRLNSNGTGTGLFINGQKQFNYIAVSHTASILPTQNVSGSFIYSTTEHSSSISVVSGSRITFANTGTYNIQFSAQFYAPTNNTNIYIWFKKNGTNIANSATQIDIGTSDYGVAAWNYIDTFTSGSYAEIAYQTDQNNVQFQYSASTGNVPAIPSIIATVTQVA